MDKFYVNCLIQNDGSKDVWRCSCTEFNDTMEEALEQVEWYRVYYPKVILAWIDDGQGNVIWLKDFLHFTKKSEWHSGIHTDYNPNATQEQIEEWENFVRECEERRKKADE